jgi:peptidoglycan/LPS O-acetylase OafA/YrhL
MTMLQVDDDVRHVQSTGRIAALDGLRGLAATLVILQHTWVTRLGAGSMGVEIFFVLSGFLIGGILFDTVGKPGWVARFYLRRTLRIWPLYFAVVACILATDMSVAHPTHAPAWMLWAFLGNFIPLSPDSQRLSANVLWSLAIEEHFYLLLPLVIAFVDRRRVPLALLFIAASSVGLRVYFDAVKTPWFSYHMTFCRLDILSMGVLAAWIHRYRREWLLRLREAALLLAGGKIGSLGYDPWARNGLWDSALTTTAESMATAVIVLSLANAEWPSASRILSRKPIAYLGTISYGLYLLHPLVLEAMYGGRTAQEIGKGPELFLMVMIPSVAIASASWFYFEQPVLSLSARSAARPVTMPGVQA